ncbi:MAG: hypothetical protein IT452_23695 [Planctomycetia bacterium]|nr:hypothetical protein [Planctomycetia bacterium]
MAGVTVFRCVNHPDRAAIGMCVRCRSAICADCTTKVQGINHCLKCLERRVAPSDTSVRRPAASTTPAGIAASFAFFALAFGVAGAVVVALL